MFRTDKFCVIDKAGGACGPITVVIKVKPEARFDKTDNVPHLNQPTAGPTLTGADGLNFDDFRKALASKNLFGRGVHHWQSGSSDGQFKR